VVPIDDARAVLEQALNRRTIAVISHPDAGKSTLTEALLLHAAAITEAGAVHAKPGRRGTTSDWMTLEQERGISVSSAAVQFTHAGAIINLIDTPGHADFSEDTYRVLTAVDSVIMLIDAAKGLESQTMKLFDVAKRRGIPILSVINKWDRPGRDALSLMDEIAQRTGMSPTPVNWPIGESGNFLGLLDVAAMTAQTFSRTAHGAQIAQPVTLDRPTAERRFSHDWINAVDEADLLQAAGLRHDESTFLKGASTPVFFAAAVHNIGVGAILDALARFAPHPHGRIDDGGRARPVDSSFSATVFKVQSGTDRAHHDRLAFLRVCSGRFERGMQATHTRTGRPFSLKYAQQVFGRTRTGIDEAWPGDVIGLVNASALQPGDTLAIDPTLTYPRLPRFTPEHFRVIRPMDASRRKQLQRALDELDEEGVVQVLYSDLRGPHSPILGAVGPLQYDVVEHRMDDEFHTPISLEPLPFTIARATDARTAELLRSSSDVEFVHRSNGQYLALFTTPYRLRALQSNHPTATLEPLDASTDPHLSGAVGA